MNGEITGSAIPKPMTLTESVASIVGAVSDLEGLLGIQSENVACFSPATSSDGSNISLLRNKIMESNDRIRRIIEVLKENL